MDINASMVSARGIRFTFDGDSGEAARAYLYLMHNDLHEEPFGLLEDVHVDETLRGRGIGKELVHEVIKRAREERCYKIIATSRFSRPGVHEFYEEIGFVDYGKEFRLDLV